MSLTRLEIDPERWQGVPFYIRARKFLPITYTEDVVRLRRSVARYQDLHLNPNSLRLRISPEILFSLSGNVLGIQRRMLRALACEEVSVKTDRKPYGEGELWS